MDRKAASFGELLEKELPPQRDWLGPGIIPKGGLVIMGADSKAGKSMFALEIARAISTGVSPFAAPMFHVPESARVLYIDAEVGERGLQDRGRKIFADSEADLLKQNLWYVSQDPKMVLSTLEGVHRLSAYVADVQPNVLILDPIGRLHAHDENDNTAIGALMHEFDVLRRRHEDLSIVLIHHLRKKGGNSEGAIDPLSFHNYRGSSRFAADPDTLITLHRLGDYKGTAGRKAWRVDSRWITRQAEQPDDMTFTVNDLGDLRVRYSGGKAAAPKLDPALAAKPKVPTEQMKLAEAEPETKAPWFMEGTNSPVLWKH